MKQLTSISKSQIISKGVQSLADRPNASAQYGAGGLSSTQLKLWFDKLATFLAEKINELQTTLASEEAADYIRIPLEHFGVESLKDIAFDIFNRALALGQPFKTLFSGSRTSVLTTGIACVSVC